MTASKPLLHVEQLSAVSPAGWQALVSATFSMTEGECVAVIGPNGSGKSSLLKAITGEYLATQGTLTIAGMPVSKMSPQQKAKMIAVVAQNDHVDSRLSVREYVSLGRVPHTFCCCQDRHERVVSQALDELNLTYKSARKMGSLSGGEQQRAHIARAFAQEPQLLLLDEPTNHLDPLARLELLELVRRKGIASIAVLHDLPLVAPFADKVVLMSQQSVVMCDTASVIMQNEYINPIFGLQVLTFNHPQKSRPIYHFEAASHSFYTSHGAA
ncbi:ABC transporter [Aeromonas cavernicola]|uniref:ABC transporter n=2 Tax=Aeromonas cavernicola TaxID=1006623 RepID=A0A2H9U095_9GAMM|nr:ABC transporter [Aeromonas cavernicola]